jgi:hypothetical protein
MSSGHRKETITAKYTRMHFFLLQMLVFRYTLLGRKYLRHSTVIKMTQCISSCYISKYLRHSTQLSAVLYCSPFTYIKRECTFLSNAPTFPKGHCCLKVPATTVCSADSSVHMSMARCSNDDTVTPTYSDRNLSQCHFVHHKSHMGLPTKKFGPPRREAGD